MLIRFWGVRGSLPTPLSSEQIQSKIMAAIQRITPDDIVNEEARAKFISSLPSWIFGTTGGNTPCVQVKVDETELIFDAGTGIRLLGKSQVLPKDNHFNLFFSHFHWDHIQGLPFFDPAYNPKASFDVYSTNENAKEYLQKQMAQPFYPVPFEAFTKNFIFHTIKEGESFYVGNAKIICCKMSHPGSSFSYAVIQDNKKFVYATDVELKSKQFADSENEVAVFKNADCIVLDSQYTVEEAFRKENLGHSAFCYAIDFAIHYNIKNIYLFHHEPTYDDKKLDSMLQAARWYAQYIEHSDIKIHLAKEDTEIIL